MRKELKNKAVKDLKELGIAYQITKAAHYRLFDEFCKSCPDRRKVRNKNDYACKHAAIVDGMHEWYCHFENCPHI